MTTSLSTANLEVLDFFIGRSTSSHDAAAASYRGSSLVFFNSLICCGVEVASDIIFKIGLRVRGIGNKMTILNGKHFYGLLSFQCD